MHCSPCPSQRMLRALLPLAAVLLTGACTPAVPDSPCLLSGEAGFLTAAPGNPFPSMHLVARDESSATGCRVQLRQDTIPVGSGGALDLQRFNRRDGFSPAGTLWVRLEEALEQDSLPPLSDLGRSLGEDASVQLWNLDSGERIPHFAELDAWQPQNDVDRALLIRPMVAMGFGTRVAAVLTSSLRRADGSPWQGPEDFLQLRDGKRPDGRSDALWEHYSDLLGQLEGHGLERGSVQLAWDFITASETNLRAPLDRVLDTMRTELPLDPEHEVEAATSLLHDALQGDPISAGLWREVRGSIPLTHFLWADDPEDPDPTEHDHGMFLLDDQGLPTPRGLDAAYFTLIVPESLQDAPAGSAPVIVFGHGLFSAPQDYLSAAGDPNEVIALCNSMQAICIGGEWRGLTERDRPDALRVATDVSRFPLLTDKLIQGLSNQLALARLMQTRFIEEPFLQASTGGSLVNRERTYYYGISLGGIMGGAFIGNSEVVESGVLHVPGAMWSTLLERSSNWTPLEAFLVQNLSTPFERQLLYSATQLLWDPVDPINHLGGVAEKNVLWQVSVGDEQVPNLTAESLARSLGLPLVAPEVHPVFGLQTAETPLGPGASGYFQFHPGMPLPDEGNRPAAVTGAHGAIRLRPEAREQVLVFLHDGIEGTIIHPCDGPCLLGDEGD